MRWERLFDDVEAQLEAAERAELASEVADRTRREVARLRVVDRLRACIGLELRLTVLGSGAVRGQLERVGPDWLLLRPGSGPAVLVVRSALLAVDGLSVAAVEPGSEGPVLSRLDIGHVLRAIARDRAPVSVWLVDGTRLDGTIDRVGADAMDLALHPAGESRREAAVRSVCTVVVDGIGLLRPG